MTTAMFEDAVAILAVCRDRLIDRMSAVFTRQVGRANDEFLSLADRATSLEHQQTCLTATQVLSNRAPQLLQQFQASFAREFESVLKGDNASQTQGLQLPTELSLVEDEDLEQDLAITKLTTRAAFNCSQQLVALDRRIAALLKVPRITQDDNPLHPGVIYKSMLQALTGMDLVPHVALALLQSFERHTGPELPAIYADINRYLAETGVLPNISLKAPEEQQGYSGSGQGGGSMGGAGYAAAGYAAPGQQGGGSGVGGGTTGQDLFNQLLSAIQSMHGQGAGPSGGAWMPGGGMPGGGMPGGGMPGGGMPVRHGGAGANSFTSNQLVEALGNLQRGPVDPSQMPGLGSVQIDPFAGNALQQLRATPMASWSHPMDAMTMDIVSMLFDAMFNDPDLPASVRAEIAKLQIPVLKVALIDKQFFSDRNHPARRLLDAIAHAGIGRGDKDQPRLTEKIRAVVEAILKGFESDVQVFESQLAVLNNFLHEEEVAAKSKADNMVDELEARERKEMAAGRVGAEVDLRINRRRLPPLLADFITRHWRLVLVEAFVRAGESGEAWKEALRHMDELIWSVEPKSSSQDRDRLVVMLPAMLKGLREGLGRVGLQGAWDGFFSELIQLHVSALHKDAPPQLYPQGPRSGFAEPLSKSRSSLQPPSMSVADPLSNLDDDDAAEESEDLSALIPEPPSQPAAPPDDEYMSLVKKLEVGAWVEFNSERGTRSTLRLNWVSEFRRVFLFTNRQGENAMTLAAGSLADHLRRGRARLLSQNPLTDRAVAQVLEKVSPATPASSAGSRPSGYAWE
ncbi:DUF1631 domain-containing protein [Thiorhodococcus mannitoliphagus]|uniref:DUF1631 domain-containing protein n=1 Tax=Thiorhodococcus mannitoliphagus TaxID=329406 RepID=UPI001F0E2D2C|nr:DUF1631 domain-containing protein [Thiorhodococcus mannitoliphagus]